MQANMSSSFKKGDCISADSVFSNITEIIIETSYEIHKSAYMIAYKMQ